jgi:hypothetical protein
MRDGPLLVNPTQGPEHICAYCCAPAHYVIESFDFTLRGYSCAEPTHHTFVTESIHRVASDGCRTCHRPWDECEC